MRFFGWFRRKKPEPHFKVGLALGSGGAKGYAELGALYAFEQNGISFDAVAGSSIGAIIGAFYANGYSATDIVELLKTVDAGSVKNALSFKVDDRKLFGVLDDTIGSLKIEELKKPFKAVATVYETGEKFVFDKGNVAKALCASAAYLPFFRPVEIEGVKLVDGAFSDSVPCDLLKKDGADFIVGIDLSTHEKSSVGFFSALFPEYTLGAKEPWKEGYENADVMLHPDLSGYKSISFGAGNEMFDIGYACAIEAIPRIKRGIDEKKREKGVKNKR